MSGRRWMFTIPNALPPGPNVRMHWRAQMRIKKIWRDDVAAQVKAARVSGPIHRARVVITLFRRAGPPKDADNAVASCKHMIDGLIVGGLLVDDSAKHITIEVRQVRAASKGVRIEVEEEEEDNGDLQRD